MDEIRQRLIDKFNQMLSVNSVYYNMYDELNDLLYGINDNPFNFIEMEKFFKYVKLNISESEFIKNTINVLRTFEVSKYYDLPKDFVNRMISNPYYESIIEKTRRFCLHCSLQSKIEDVILYLETLCDNEYIDSSEINKIFISDLKFDLREKIAISKLISRYNIGVSKNVKEMLERDISNIDLNYNEEETDDFKEDCFLKM